MIHFDGLINPYSTCGIFYIPLFPRENSFDTVTAGLRAAIPDYSP